MHRFVAEGQAADDAEPVPVALHQLLRDVLTPLAEEHGVEDLALTAQMLDLATRHIGDELFFVDLSRLRNED